MKMASLLPPQTQFQGSEIVGNCYVLLVKKKASGRGAYGHREQRQHLDTELYKKQSELNRVEQELNEKSRELKEKRKSFPITRRRG